MRLLPPGINCRVTLCSRVRILLGDLPLGSESFSEIYLSGRRASGLVGILELQETRWSFSRARPKCGRSLSFNWKVRADGSRGKSSPQFSRSGGTNPNRCHCAKCTTRTPGLKIYRYYRGRSRPFDRTDDTTSQSLSIAVDCFDPFHVAEILFTLTARNWLEQ